MLVISPIIWIGVRAENKLTNTMNKILLFQGVLNLGWISLNSFGNSPSLDME